MSKFFTVKDHDIRLSEIAAVGPVLPEYDDVYKQQSSGAYGFTISLCSGIKLEPIYRPSMLNRPVQPVVLAIRSELMKALNDDD